VVGCIRILLLVTAVLHPIHILGISYPTHNIVCHNVAVVGLILGALECLRDIGIKEHCEVDGHEVVVSVVGPAKVNDKLSGLALQQ
jgi:hypothetical protein